MTGTSRIRRPRHRSFKGLLRQRLDHTLDSLTVGAAPVLEEFTFTVDDTANTLTITGQDQIPNGTRVIFNGDDLADPLEEGTLYHIMDAGLDLYAVYNSLEDAVLGQNPIDFVDVGSGTQSMTILEN